MIKIYSDPITVNCRKVLAGLQYLGVAYDRVHVDFFQSDHKKPSYKSLNPNMTMPTLVDGDLVLWESNAILKYVAEKASRADVYPSDLKARADIDRWLLWEAANWFPTCYVYMVENCAKPLMGLEADAGVLAANAEVFDKHAGILDARLSDREWLCGDNITLADFAVAAPLHMHEEARIPLHDYKHLARWMKHGIERLECWKNTHVGPGFTLAEPEHA